MSANDKKGLYQDYGDDPPLWLQYNVSPSTSVIGEDGNPRQPAIALKATHPASTIVLSVTTITGDLTKPPVFAADQPSNFSSTNVIVNGTSSIASSSNVSAGIKSQQPEDDNPRQSAAAPETVPPDASVDEFAAENPTTLPPSTRQ